MIVDRERILKGIQNIDDKQVAARVLDGIQYVIKEHSTYTTDFLDPHERQASHIHHQPDSGYRVYAFGGYRRAERQVMVILPNTFRESVKPPITSVEISETLERRSLHTGLSWCCNGFGSAQRNSAISLWKNGCQLVLMKDIVEYVLTNLKTVGRYGVRVVEIDTEQLNVEPERVKEITGHRCFSTP